MAGELAEDEEADEDDDDDSDETAAQTAEDALATLRTENAALKRQLQRKTGAATKRSTWKANSLSSMPPDTQSLLEPKDILAVRDGVPTPSPTPPTLLPRVPPTATLPTRNDSHM